MQTHDGWNGVVTTKHLVGLVVAAGLAIGGEAAAQGYVDGARSELGVSCDGAVAIGPSAYVGYYVDPIAETPKLGEPVPIHAVVFNLSACDVTVGIELFLPPGARFDATHPVACYLDSTPLTRRSECLQTPEPGNFGGSFFGSKTIPAWSAYEIQVPVVFEQALAGASLTAAFSNVWAPLFADVAVTAPFAASSPVPTPPPMPTPVTQPTPNAYAIGDDIALLGSSPAQDALPVAFSNDDGTFTVTSHSVGSFAGWARTANVQRLSGDFNGDGRTDFALVGGAGWQSIPVALSNGDGTFTIHNQSVPFFPSIASQPNVKALTGDFNRDGATDIALVGGTNYTTIPIAFYAGNGTFTFTNKIVPNFPWWATSAGARALTGDFNKDGLADIALTGVPGWNTVPVAFSYGDGSFLVTNKVVSIPFTVINGSVGPGANFGALASAPGVQVVTGDFNKDGSTDLALTGGFGFTTIPLALSRGDGTFSMYNNFAPSFPAWATSPGVKVLTGDFNGDGYTDLALTGVAGWATIPVALNLGFGTFAVVNSNVGVFGSFASTPGVRAVAGDYNGDGHTDIALTGGATWGSIPVAFSIGFGAFDITNDSVIGFAGWSSDTAASALVGRMN